MKKNHENIQKKSRQYQENIQKVSKKYPENIQKKTLRNAQKLEEIEYTGLLCAIKEEWCRHFLFVHTHEPK